MVDRRLGRGLEFFLSKGNSGTKTEKSSEEGPDGRLDQVELQRLVPNPHQPRREFPVEEIRELAASIRSSGILQPLLARQVGDRYQIIAGERRWRAAKEVGLERVPVVVRQITDELAAVYGLVENLHREDLNPMEKAKAFERIQAITKGNQEEVARQVGLERSTVANFVRLLDLPDEVQALVSRGTLSMGQARAILGLGTNEERVQVAEQAVRNKMSVRELERLVSGLKSQPKTATKRGGKPSSQPPAWLKEIEDNLEESLSTPVAVRYSKKRSRIQIECLGRDEFERIYEMLKNLGS